jgi:hypothetical protein
MDDNLLDPIKKDSRSGSMSGDTRHTEKKRYEVVESHIYELTWKTVVFLIGKERLKTTES